MKTLNSSIDIQFERTFLRETIEELRTAFPKLDYRDAWVIKTCGQWEFHFKGFYWNGRANSAYDARAKGWRSWAHAQGVVL